MSRVLFLCTGNSCRSQMAEGFARQLPGIDVIESAGTEAHGLNPRAVQVMAEVDVDISNQRSTVLDEDRLADFDAIITLCGDAAERCPAVPGSVRKLHWPVADPASCSGSEEEILTEFRRVRDEIHQRVNALKNVLPFD